MTGGKKDKGGKGLQGKGGTMFSEKSLTSCLCCIDCTYLYYNTDILYVCAHRHKLHRRRRAVRGMSCQ